MRSSTPRRSNSPGGIGGGASTAGGRSVAGGGGGGGCVATPTGITFRGSFHCEARCFCPVGDNVWVGERNGLITIRCGRSGNVLSTVEPNSTNFLFASAMTVVDNEMWIGSTDGRLCVINVDTEKLVVELVSPETERTGEVFAIAVEGNALFTATANCRVAQWDIPRKIYTKSFVHSHPVRAVVASPYCLYSADDSGTVYCWEIKTGERLDSTKDSVHGCTSLLLEETSNTLWAGRIDGRVDVYQLEPLLRLSSLTDAKGRINCLMQVGGKVWGSGMDRTVFVWHAITRTLLGKTKDHSAFIFSIKKLYSMETSRVWSLSNDKTINIYDGEGFFAPVKALNKVHEEVTNAQTMSAHLRKENALLEKKLAIATEKIQLREHEFERTRTENQQFVLKIHTLEHVVDSKEESLLDTKVKSTKMFDELDALSKRVGELTMKVNQAEQDKAQLRGDLARTEEQLSRERSKVTEKTSTATLVETERVALASDKQRLATTVESKEKENLDLGFQVKSLRDELSCRSLDMARMKTEMELAKNRVRDLEHEKESYELEKKAAFEERRRLDDTIILRENEVRDLTNQLAQLSNRHHTSSNAISDLESQAQFRKAESKRLEDNYALRTHEFDLVKQEKMGLLESLQHEKAQVHDARASENKLRLQNDELRRQLEHEKSAVKMLEDQYTIFQFVINSRGELVQAIWDLRSKLDGAGKSVKSVDAAVKHLDPTKDKAMLKHEWKTNVCAKASGSLDVINQVQSKADYIVSNFFSEYEKMHLGVSAAKFPPDAARPAVVGDELLTKLRDVTLSKQFAVSKPAAASRSATSQYADQTILPPPHDPAMGPNHTAPVSGGGWFNSTMHQHSF